MSLPSNQSEKPTTVHSSTFTKSVRARTSAEPIYFPMWRRSVGCGYTQRNAAAKRDLDGN